MWGNATSGAREPLICLTKRQRQKLADMLKGMTLAGAMALALKDGDKFKTIHVRQQAIIQALGVLDIQVEVDEP